MGAARKLVVQGSKGGESTQKQPTIAANSTASIATARIVYLWSWGPIVGPVDGLRSVKLDGTPLVAEDGTVNFPGVKWQFRNGELNQQRLEGIAESSNEVDVNQQLLSTTPYLRTVNNPVLDALRIRLSWPQLQSQDQSGNINGVRVDYAIDLATDGGPFVQMLADFVDRKNVTKYERSHRINLPAGSRWTMRVRRITPEANSSLIQDSMFIEAVAEVVDSDQEFPLTAVGCVEYDAQQFGGDIAKIAVLMRGRIVRVPTNYDPETRTYATSGAGTSNGIWDGTFKEAYTNNPAWVCYDIALNPYYGLGHRIDATMVDRWNLYRIAQYCDQMVPNGMGGMHPRMTCNIYLQKQADAYAVLQDLSSIFHGMSTWDGSQITFNADMPGDPVYTYNPSQILNNGEIQYSGTRARDRHNLALVTWDNPDQSFATDKEPVFDEVALAESGSVNELSVDAYGCTSLAQAQRAGQYALITEQTQTRGGTFRVGLDGSIPKTGQIIAVADPMLAGRANGGRISEVAGRVITVDRDIDLPTGAKLRVNLPSGKTEARVISSLDGRRVTVAASFSEVPEAECGWILEYDDLKTMQFLVRNITRPEWHQYQLECIQHEPSKFDAIDFGAVVDIRPISGIPVGVQAAPAGVFVTQHVVVEQGIAVVNMTISWDAAPGAVAYDVEWRWGSREWVKVPRTGEQSVEVTGIYSGQYMARVRAVSALNVSSLPTTSQLTNLEGKVGLPPAITSLAAESLLFGIGLKWSFPPGAEDAQRTELWYAQANDLKAATKLADLAYPQADYVMQGLRAGQTFFFWARLVDRTGNIGPWFPLVDGVMGSASADAAAILEQIAGEITESAFGKDLLSKLEKIEGNGPGSVNERLAIIRTALNEQIADVDGNLADVRAELQQQIDNIADLADSMPYKPDGTYKAGQGVLGSDGIIYQATQNVPVNTPPPNTTYWLNVGQAVATAVGLASRVQTVETKVTSIEGVNTAQAQQLTGLQTSLDGKASASSVQSIGNRVTDAEGKLTSQSSAITGLTNALPGKANVATVDALTNTVNQQGGAITAQGQSLTNIAASISTVGGQNLIYNPSFEKRGTIGAGLIGDGWQIGGPATLASTSYVQSGIDSKGIAQRADVTNLNPSRYIDVVPAPEKRPSAGQGQPFTFSCYVRATPGLGIQIFLQPLNSASAVVVTVNSSTLIATGEWQRHTLTIPSLPANTATVHCITRLVTVNSATAGFLEVDRVQAQLAAVVSGWQDNADTVKTDLAGQAEATSALTARVTQNETSITSASSQLSSLSNSVGTSGGQNLFFNPTFSKESASAGTAEGWITDSGASGGTSVPSIVPSWLVSSEKAQRLDVTGLNLSNSYRGIRVSPANYRPKVMAGNSVVASCYVRATAGLVFKIFIQGVNAAGTDAVTVSGPLIVATGGTQRIVYDYPNLPAGTASVQAYFRLYGSDTVGSGFAEYTRAQLEVGTTVTGWRDNTAVLASEQSATSVAVSGLSSTVTQQANSISSVSGRTTSLENTVNSSTNGLATKASASALSSTQSAVSQQGQTLTAQSTQIQGLNASLGDTNANVSSVNQALANVNNVLASRIDGVTSTVGNVSAAIQSEATTRASADAAIGRSIDSLSSSVGTAYAAIQSESVTRADADGALSRRVDDVQSTAGNANAYAQQAINTAASVDGKVSGSYTVKLGVTANGIQYASGFGLGLDNSAGPTQSRFVVSADSFAILNANPNDGAVFSPFAVTGGQVFINEVFIKNGSIDNAKIGDMLYSSNYQPQRAGWLLKKDGVFEINSTIPGAGRVLINGNGVYIYDENNVLRVQLGNLG
ncbi:MULTISPECIES: TipJ family phage tail tip protein [Pseudomonas]|uniref:TipJ family phage tail tip protein n=1 Tax=Pseudomonas TaxID=286 RepID=UPI001AE6D409